jgi:hypothetical protein
MSYPFPSSLDTYKRLCLYESNASELILGTERHSGNNGNPFESLTIADIATECKLRQRLVYARTNRSLNE